MGKSKNNVNRQVMTPVLLAAVMAVVAAVCWNAGAIPVHFCR